MVESTKVFNPEVYEKVDPPPFTKNIQLEYNDREVYPVDYDLINRKIIHNQLLSDDTHRVSIAHPGTTSLLLQSLLQCSVTSLYQNLFDEERSILNHIDTGDIVIFEDKRVRYEGQETVRGIRGFWVEFEGQDGQGRAFQPLENAYKLDTYEGDASSIESISNERGAEQEDKEIISKMYGIPPESLAVKPKIKIVVVTSKTSLKSHLRNLHIDDHLFTELFPAGDYRSEDDYVYLTGSRSSSDAEPFIAITHNFSLAEKIIRKNKGQDELTDVLILDGHSKFKYHQADIDRVVEKNLIKNELRLIERSEMIGENSIETSDLKTWVWTDKEIHNLDPGGDTIKDGTDPFELQKQLLRNIANQNREIDIIDQPELDDLLDNGIENLLELSKNVERKDFKINRFFKETFDLYFLFKELCVPISFVEEIREENDEDSFYETLIELEKIPEQLIGLYITDETAEKMESVIENLKRALEILRTENKKADNFKEYISSHDQISQGETAIAVNNSKLKSYLEIWLKDEDIHVLELKQVAKDQRVFGNLIFPGYWYKKTYNRLIGTGRAENQFFILYENEATWLYQFLEKLERNEIQNLNPSVRTNLLDLDREDSVTSPEKKSYEYSDKESEKAQSVSEITDLEQYIRNANLDYIQERADDVSEEESERTVKSRLFEFADENIAYLTPHYTTNVFNRIEEKIENKKPADLQEGDELIFLTDRESVFEPFLEELEKKEEYQDIKELSNLWQRSLREYAEEQELLEQKEFFDDPEDPKLKVDFKPKILKEISTEIEEMTGINRKPSTIERWINDDVLNPDHSDIILRAIAEITGDQRLKSQLNNVLEACSRRHGIHAKLGRKVAQYLLQSAFKADVEKDDDWDLISDIEIDQNIENSIQIVTIQEIIEETENVPVDMTNKLIDVSS